jgi:hypothetical protein
MIKQRVGFTAHSAEVCLLPEAAIAEGLVVPGDAEPIADLASTAVAYIPDPPGNATPGSITRAVMVAS